MQIFGYGYHNRSFRSLAEAEEEFNERLLRSVMAPWSYAVIRLRYDHEAIPMRTALSLFLNQEYTHYAGNKEESRNPLVHNFLNWFVVQEGRSTTRCIYFKIIECEDDNDYCEDATDISVSILPVVTSNQQVAALDLMKPEARMRFDSSEDTRRRKESTSLNMDGPTDLDSPTRDDRLLIIDISVDAYSYMEKRANRSRQYDQVGAVFLSLYLLN
ncbi:unnamed protein product [Heligmosomoides polygyrus]|uniref:Pyridoxal 5'-phosphate synthase n=1 Tax=Heligmosomoides polygyrus TaxID=6339 RepID=A0A183G554_HELPZ|nr:unnamed protein product [Heligmosomoides polygyrus]